MDKHIKDILEQYYVKVNEADRLIRLNMTYYGSITFQFDETGAVKKIEPGPKTLTAWRNTGRLNQKAYGIRWLALQLLSQTLFEFVQDPCLHVDAMFKPNLFDVSFELRNGSVLFIDDLSTDLTKTPAGLRIQDTQREPMKFLDIRWSDLGFLGRKMTYCRTMQTELKSEDVSLLLPEYMSGTGITTRTRQVVSSEWTGKLDCRACDEPAIANLANAIYDTARYLVGACNADAIHAGVNLTLPADEDESFKTPDEVEL